MAGDWVEQILAFWFTDLTPEDWWVGSAEIDSRIRNRFLGPYDEIATGVPASAWHEPRSALAAIIALDQFPRNMFRKTPRAFATDAMALELSKNAVEKGLDQGLGEAERQFMYMPHVHSESLADQDECVRLFHQFDDEETLKHAIEHRDIVERFGRFPHRNRLLGRENTPEETAFMSEHKGFGQ